MRKSIKYGLAIVGLLAVLALASAGFVAWRAHVFLTTAPEEPGQDMVVQIDPGMTFDQVAALLKARNLITDVDRFRLLGKWEKKLGSIQAGEFRLRTDWMPRRVLDELVSGRPVLYRLSLREGLTWWQTARVVEQAGYGAFDEVSAAVHDKDMLLRRHIPFDTAEGFLFPETYMLQRPRKGDAQRVVEMLVNHFWENAAQVWPDGTPDPRTLARTVILASLVEKETAAPEERARIAGVYANRLRKRMLLQCDPTVIYGLGTAFNGNLQRHHLEDKSNPYNTYRHAGLPPGPICSPGLASLQAAANPEEHKFLYFVSRKDGTHHFSRTLAEHNEAVRTYQLRHRRKN